MRCGFPGFLDRSLRLCRHFFLNANARPGLRALVAMLAVAAATASASAQSLVTFSPAVAVGSTSSAQLLQMTAIASGTVKTVEVLTQGQPNLDYAAAGMDTCTGAALTTNSTCRYSVSFTPKYPGVRPGAVVLLNSANQVLAITYLSGTGSGALGVFVPGTMLTVAGSGDWTGLGDGQAATSGDLYLPAGVVLDGAGNMYIADSSHNRIREVYGSGANKGQITTLCNTTGQPAYSGDGGPALTATLSNPQGIAIDGAGNLYIADTGNNAIRKIDAFTGIITSVVSQEPTSTATSTAGFSGDGQAATSAQLDTPYGITVAPNGDLYIADTKNQRIRMVTASSGIITTFAGNGAISAPGTGTFAGDGGAATSASLDIPYAVTLDTAGNVYIADTGNNRIRVVYGSGSAKGEITTFAGNGNATYAGDGGVATSASFYAPSGLIFDVAGNLYVADTQNNRVRKISTSGVVSTAAGNGTGKYEGDGGPANAAGLYGPQGMFLDGLGNLYIADYFDQRIRAVQDNLVILTFPTAIREDQVAGPTPQTIENDGNVALNFTAVAPDSNAAVDAASTTCAVSSPLSIDAQCVVGAEFAPTEVGNPVIGNIDLTGNTPNTPLDIQVEGESDALTSTTTTLNATPNPALFGTAVVLSATVTTGTGTLGGSVKFMDGATLLGTATLASSGQTGTATISTSSLSLGAHSLTAVYVSDGVHGASTSGAFTETIEQSTTTTLSSSQNPSVSGSPVTFTSIVTGNSGGTAPTGTVVFKDGGTTIGSIALTGSTATYTSSTLSTGTHSITAVYQGDTLNAGSTSPAVSQQVKASTTVALASSANPASYGATISFTAKVVDNNNTTPTGTVTFTIDGTSTYAATLNGGTASIQLSSLTVGTHAVVATYNGDSNNGTATSSGLTETVNKATATVTLASTPNPSASGAAVSFTAIIKGGSTAPTGQVVLESDGTPIGSQTIAGGQVSFSISTLAVGTHSITAVYQGDTNYASVTSAAVSQKVQPNASAAVTSNLNPSIAGTSITLKATITGTSTPTGTVVFKDGATSIGSAGLSGGAGTFTTSALPAGTHSITAVYSGDTNNAATTSAVYTQVVNQATTKTAVTASANPTTAGKSVTLSATVTGNGGTPTGTVDFYSAGVLIGAGGVNGSGVATFTTTKLGVGTDSITATYTGDTNDTSSTSAAYALSVVSATSTVALTSSANPATALKPVTFTATVAGNGGTPTGTVNFSDGGTLLGSASLGSTGVATFTTSSLAVGTHSIVAAYQGDTNDSAANGTLTESIVQAAPALTVISSTNPATVGTSVTFSAGLSGQTGTATGSVAFKDGGTTLGSVNIASNGVATFSTSSLALGQHSITAVYSGDTNNAAVTSPAISQTMQESTTTAIVSSKNPSVGGTAVTFTATVAGTSKGTPTGTVTFRNGASVLGTATLSSAGVATYTTSTLPVGTDDITASYSGDTLNVVSTSAALAQMVQSAGTATTLVSSANPSLYGATVTFTATVKGDGATPTGTVSFDDGATVIGTGTLSSAGVATISTSALSVGVHAITAVYSGDADNQKGTSAAVNQAVQAQSAVAVSSNANPALAAASVTFTATVTNGNHGTPTGTISFKDGATVLATETLPSTGVATYSTTALAVGTHAITATYSGDTDDTAATSAVLSEAVTAIATKTTLAASPTSVTTEQTVNLVASVFSSGSVPITGTVTFQSGSTVIGTASVTSAGTATLAQTLAAGTYSIVAVYSGDANNAASTSTAVTVKVAAADDFSMSVNPTSISMASKQYKVVTLTLTSTAGFADTLGLGCASLPASVTCAFSSNSVKLAANGTATVQVTVDTSSPLTAGGSAKNEAPGSSSRTALAWAFPGSVLMGLVFWRFRRKHGLVFTLMAIVLLGGAAFGMTGCGGLSENGASAGSYSFEITASGQNTGMDHSIPISLTVSQ